MVKNTFFRKKACYFLLTKTCSWIPCKLVIPSRNSVTFISWKNSFSDISRKYILHPNIRSHPTRGHPVTTVVIFGSMHFLLISENEFFCFFLWRKTWQNYESTWNSWAAPRSLMMWYSCCNRRLLNLVSHLIKERSWNILQNMTQMENVSFGEWHLNVARSCKIKTGRLFIKRMTFD